MARLKGCALSGRKSHGRAHPAVAYLVASSRNTSASRCRYSGAWLTSVSGRVHLGSCRKLETYIESSSAKGLVAAQGLLRAAEIAYLVASSGTGITELSRNSGSART